MSNKFIAITTIQRTVEPGVARTPDNPGKRPVVKTIKPNTVLVIDDANLRKQLLDAKAIRPATTKDTEGVKTETLEADAPATSNSTTTRTSSTTQSGETVNTQNTTSNAGTQQGGAVDLPTFDAMTGAQLDAHLEDNKIDAPTGWSSMTVGKKREWLTSNTDTSGTGAGSSTSTGGNADDAGAKNDDSGLV